MLAQEREGPHFHTCIRDTSKNLTIRDCCVVAQVPEQLHHPCPLSVLTRDYLGTI
jgi:hypothetical protein